MLLLELSSYLLKILRDAKILHYQILIDCSFNELGGFIGSLLGHNYDNLMG